MADGQMVWVDAAQCTGCGACVEVCSVGALTVVDDQARVDEEICTGCGVCVDACLQGAIQPVIRGELILASARPSPTVYRPSPLVEKAGAAVAVAGAGLLVRASQALARVVARWLLRRLETSEASQAGLSGAERRAGRRQRARHRRRGQ